ncbi:MAG: SUMF1/EgtB/PvdO family nonheme iron enzyme [Fibrobacterota bacterium]
MDKTQKRFPKKRVFRILAFTALFLLLFLLARFLTTPRDAPVENPLNLPQTGTVPAVTAPLGFPEKPAVDLPRKGFPTPAVLLPDRSPVSNPALPVDKTPPYVHAEPGPGRHPAPIAVKLLSDEPAALFFRVAPDTVWSPYTAPYPVKDSVVLAFYGRDSAGNVSEPVTRVYTVARALPPSCPAGMVPVTPREGRAFCIDLYEWPNKKGALPLAYVNWYMAYDSCRTYKKRLCETAEWEAACLGPDGSAYPYGNTYEPRVCNTEDNSVRSSGSFTECRSYTGAYDLSGNLREWSNTKAKNERHYRVAGGYWANRGATQCNASQYSFYPENSFTSVGFRCCADAGTK